MPLETVLDTLEAKIDELVEAHAAAQQRAAELEARVNELEGDAASGAEEASARVSELEAAADEASQRVAELESAAEESEQRIQELETQRTELGERLEKVLAAIDGVLASGDDD